MSGKKVYEGEKIKFERLERIGKGGNGAVYKVKIVEGDISYPVVAKFFDYSKEYKVKRYERFKREIEVISELQGEITGIINILDKKCPKYVPDDGDTAWYLMPEARNYKLKIQKSLLRKIDDMLIIALTISELHKRNLAHRDIKPENILLLNNHIILADFGLVWANSQKRITDEGERIGPYKILPPELENIDFDVEIDYRVSDVYLFAKVLWMNIKQDDFGFRGQYNRKDKGIYINSKEYDVDTLEPIHCLLEGATYNEIVERITIDKCIDYLKLQKLIINGELSKNEIDRLRFKEIHKEVINDNVPNKYIYEDSIVIYRLINSVIGISNVFVQVIEKNSKKQIQVSSIKLLSDNLLELSYFNNGKKVKEYIFKPKEIICSEDLESTEAPIIVKLLHVNGVGAEYTEFGKVEFGFGNVNNKIVITENYEIVIERK